MPPLLSPALSETMSSLIISNGFQLELRFDNERFVGIGTVASGEMALRRGLCPWWIEIATPEGVQLNEFTLERQCERDGGFDLEFSLRATPSRLMEWMLHEIRPRLNTDSWDQTSLETDARLRFEVRPVTREIDGRHFEGFSTQYHYRSAQFPIYKILERGTWEIGSSCLGSEFWLRNGTTPSICHFNNPGDFYSTEWYLPSIANPNIFQFHPFQTQFSGLTFTANESGTLLTWVNQPSHVRSLFEKKRGRDEIEHWHEHCADLASNFSTAPLEVLFCCDELNRVERANTYEAASEMVAQTLHEAIGMRRERVSTWGMIEEWGLPDLKKYTVKGVSQLLEAGIKTIAFPNFFQNNMNVWGVSNMCTTVDYQIPDSLGEAAFGAFCAAIRGGGARAQMWGNTAISSLSYIFDLDYGTKREPDEAHRRLSPLPRSGSVMEALDGAREPFVRNASGAIEADHYSPVFCQLNLRDPVVRQYWMKRWSEAHDRYGLNGIFLDSSFNMTSDKFHFHFLSEAHEGGATIDQTHLLGRSRPAEESPARIESQYFAHLSLMVEMQRAGYEICGEDIGVFGLSRSGPSLVSRLDNLFLWSDCACDFGHAEVLAAGADPDAVFFQGLAYRLMWIIHFDIQREHLSFRQAQTWQSELDIPKPWHLQLLRAYSKVETQMMEREILPDERGVLYRGLDEEILWAFADFEFQLPSSTQVDDVLAAEPASRVTGMSLCAEKHRIYRWKKS